MKNKSTHHKDSNTFKFLPFSERISQINVDVFHKVTHEYEAQTEENECYFYQTIDKWNVLNLTEGYAKFKKEIRANNYIILPQLLLNKNYVVDVLLKHLNQKDPLYLQPLLELVVALSKDLQKEFYEYYPRFLELLIEILNTKDSEQLEWTFTCLAYLFKFLWRCLIKDINSVFYMLLPLLSDNKPEYVNNFAAESFAFVARKVKDKESFLKLLLKAVINKQDGINGCAKLLYYVIKGVDGQFHSCADSFLPFLLNFLSSENIPQNVLFDILKQVFMNLFEHLHPQKSDLLWSSLTEILEKQIEIFTVNQNKEMGKTIDLLLKLTGQCIEYRNGKLLKTPSPVIQILQKILADSFPDFINLTVTQIAVLLLLSKNIKLPQDQAASLIRKILALRDKSILLFFVENISFYFSFEALILPTFLKICVINDFDSDCFHTLTKLVLKKAPLCGSGINLLKWNKYLLDFKEFNHHIFEILSTFLKINNIDEVLANFNNYFCSLICLPHLQIKEKVNLKEIFLKNISTLLGGVKNLNLNRSQIQTTLFLLNGTIECLVHLNGIGELATIFDKVLETLVQLTIVPDFKTSLKIISLILTALRNDKAIIKMDTLLKINKLEINFSSPYHEIRLLTSHIYTHFEGLSEFEIKYSADPKVPNEDFRVFSICFNAELIEPDVHTYRDQLNNLEKLNFDKPQMLMCNQTDFTLIPLRYLCGTLYINFQLLWEPVTKIIASHAHGLHLNTFWNVFGEELKNVCENINSNNVKIELIKSSCDFLDDLLREEHNFKNKVDFVNYRILLWKAMTLFADVAEVKTRLVSDLLLNFIETEYVKNNSEAALFYNIKENNPNKDDMMEEAEDNDEKSEVQLKNKNNFKGKLGGKVTLKTLVQKLTVFSQIRSPMSMYREPELYKLYFDLLQHKDANIQKLALDCIMTYKHMHLTPYKDNLYSLVDAKNFKNEVVSFKIDKESNLVQPEHRENLIPIVMQIVFSKMTGKAGLRTGGKSSGQVRRNLILKFLAGCEELEMLAFLKKAFRFYLKYLENDPALIIRKVLEEVNLDKFVSPKKLQSTINLLNAVLDQFGGLMGNELLTYLFNIVLIIGTFLKKAFDQLELVHSGYFNVLKLIRTASIKIITRFFKHFDQFPWTNKQINAIFDIFVWPSLSRLSSEGIHSPTALLKLICQWSSNPRYFLLLVKHEKESPDRFILPQVIDLLVNEKSNTTVVNCIEEMLENLLNLQPDEEDSKIPLTVDNVLPIRKDISKKVGMVDNLNYGSCILIPHAPIIMQKIKNKLQGKSKNLNQKELFILSRISELVWEADLSDMILHLLLPIVSKKCSGSVNEEVVYKFLTTVHNLIRNVEKPIIHFREISQLFAEVSQTSCRKMLTQIVKLISDKTDNSDIKYASTLIVELNAWDAKWIDQPDFERRHTAFKTIKENVENNDINIYSGVLIIYNCYFMLTSEKDLAIKENSSYTIKLLSPKLIEKYKKDSKQIDYVLNQVLFALIRRGMKSQSQDVRNECIILLGLLARECPDSHSVLRDLNRYSNKSDLEVDFFENLTHLQIHRHARALLKFSLITKDQSAAPNPRTLTQFVLPLASHYLCNEKFIGKNSILDAAIEAVGTICRVLPWHQYEGILKYYLSLLRYKADYQKQLVRLIVVILEAFHFDLSKGHVNNEEKVIKDAEKLIEETKTESTHEINETVAGDNKTDDQSNFQDKTLEVDEVLEISKDHPMDDKEESEEETDKELKNCDKTTVLCKSTATRVIKTIQSVLLPQLHKSLAQLTQHDNSHKVNRKKTGFEREEEDMQKIPISLAVVKLLQRLPVEIMESNLPGVFMKLCTFLKSHLESVRRTAREILQKIMSTLGPKYLSLLLNEMAPLLNRGYQVHVLVFTVHGVLSCLKDKYQKGDIDRVLLQVLNLCTADLFGTLSEEKEVVKITVKVSEAKSTKSYNTLQILAQFITESCLMDLILPIKQVLETSHSFKTIHKAEESLRFIVLGLVDNSFILVETLLKFSFGTAAERIPQLLTQEKKPLTNKESEKLQREKEDCLIIPKISGNRMAYRQQNVRTSLKTNAYVLIEFGLRLFLFMLKREKLRDGDYKPFIDPFIVVFKKCLKSKHVKLSTLTLQCLSWVMKYDLPSMKDNIKSITKDMFAILHKYGSAGLSKGDNFDLVVAAFKAMSVLVRDIKYHVIDTNQLKALLLYAERDMHDHDRQATAFNLLKAIIARKLIVPEIHEVMSKVAELSILSELEHVRTQARIVFHQFLMDYPLNNTLDKHLSFYISQMSYDMQYGRESAIEMIQTLINTFPLKVLNSQSGTFFVTLAARLVNDDVPECRKKIADCITTMLEKLQKPEKNDLFDIVVAWLKDKNISHRRLAAQICGLFVTIEKSNFESRLSRLLPLILKQFGLNNSPGKFVKLLKGDERRDTEEHERVKDHHIFQVLQLLLKISQQCPMFLNNKPIIEILAAHIQSLLSYPHDWVRLASAQFLGYVLSSVDTKHLSDLLVSGQLDECGYLCNDPEASLKSLTLDLCDQLQPEGVKSDLAEQVVKNLVFVAKVLQNIPIKPSEKYSKINLHWLAMRMRKVINSEVVQNSSSTVLRTEVFKWIAGVIVTVEVNKSLPVLHHLLAPLVREMVSTEENNKTLKQLAKEVSNMIKKKVGMETYMNTLSKLQQTLSVKRAERKRNRTQLAVTNPEIFAKKKIRRHDKKKEAKKRKIESLKGTKRNFKKRKVVDLEDSSEIM